MSALLVGGSAASRPAPIWRDAFQSSPAAYEPFSDAMIEAFAKQMKLDPEKVRERLKPQPLSGTVRYRVLLTGAGSKIRIRLSNESGEAPLRISAASVALAGEGFSATKGSLKLLLFGGAAGLTIPPGAPAISDPVDLPVKPGTELLISAVLATPLKDDARGSAGFAIAPGDQAGNTTMVQQEARTGRPLVSGVSVLALGSPHVIVTMGDSITDGARVSPKALHGWPQVLSARLAQRGGGAAYTVLNAGISGNRLLAPGWGPAGLARLDRDALRIEGVTHLVLLEGVNDIGMSGKSMFGDNPEVSAQDLIAGYRQVIARAHARGVKVIIGTLTPTGGSVSHSSPAKDQVRQAVNRWILTSREPDAVIDFDKIVRDPAAPSRFRKEFDSGDHLHPSEAGYRAMGEGIDLSLFR
jgi:lysophospholipase L1-like esterase